MNRARRKRKTVFVVLLAPVAIFIFMFFIIPKIISPSFDTEYTSKFTLQEFNAVRNGMTKTEVENRLGKPFYVFNESQCWGYSRNNKSGIGWLSDFTGWIQAVVCFDSEGNTRDKVENIFYN